MEKIQLVKLRSSIPKGESVQKTYHSFFQPAIVADSVQDILEMPERFLEKIPEHERYNIYYTASFTPLGSREFKKQDIIPFDLDNIDVEKKEQYIGPVCAVLGVEEDEVGVVFTGNGLQLLVGLHSPFEDKNFFEQNRLRYSELCKKIEEHLRSFNLPCRVDPSVFSPARLLRFPETLNRKKDKPERIAKVLRKNILPNGFDMKAIATIEKDITLNSDTGAENNYPAPDTQAVLNGCDFLKFLKKGDHSEPQWYAGLSILGRLENGVELSHEYSKAHVSYKPSEMERKLKQALERSGPRTCANIKSLWGGCHGCSNHGKVRSPISIKATAQIEKNKTTTSLERIAAENMLEKYSDHMCSRGEDLFIYESGVWRFVDEDMTKRFVVEAYKMLGIKSKITHAEGVVKNFSMHLPVSPVDLFTPNPYAVNFNNGTLHIIKNGENWSKEFRPHRKEDYLINKLDFDYDEKDKSENSEFLEMIDRVFANDEDKKDKIFALQQMYGACLVPAFPHLFLLHGAAGTGKTSVILPLYKFLKNENIASVEPHEFSGFDMINMAGKLVNIVTDIDTHRPMEDANIKKIEDRVPVKINRKYKSSIYSPLPAIHIFGANAIPRSLEGMSTAHQRRWTFIEFKSFQASGLYNKNYALDAFDTNPRGVLNFALRGLDMLLEAKGHFYNPPSGQRAMREWLIEGDILQKFLNDIGNGETRLEFSSEARHERKSLYEEFKNWAEETGHSKNKCPINRNEFFSAMRKKGFADFKSHGVYFVRGIQLRPIMPHCPSKITR